MSILKEYEGIQKSLGEKLNRDIEFFLSFHPEILLSDVYYNSKVFEQLKAWSGATPEYFKSSIPVYLVVENYKGICEHNFFGTKEEIMQEIGLTERELEHLFRPRNLDSLEKEVQKEELPVYFSRSNVSCSICVAKDEERLLSFFSGKDNSLEKLNDKSNWYYDLDLNRCGEKGRNALLKIAAETENKKLFFELCNQLNVFRVKRERADLQTGAAHLYALGKQVATFCDEICYQKADGSFSDGLHDKVFAYTHHGPVFAGWGSIISDEQFIAIGVKNYQKEIQAILKESVIEKKPELNTLIENGKKETTKKNKSVSNKSFSHVKDR